MIFALRVFSKMLFFMKCYLTFDKSLWKKWNGRIVSLVILIVCVTFSSLFPGVIRMSQSTGSSLVHLDSRMFRIPKEYYFPLICITFTYIIIPSNQRQNTIKIQKLQETLRRINCTGKYWVAAEQHENHFRGITWEY